MPKKLIKLHDIFLRKFLLLFTTIFLVLGVVLYLWIKDIYIEQTKIDLLHNIDIVSLQIDDFKNIDALVKKIKNKIDLRVTIISKNGTILGESDKDISSMDNHLNRIEVIQSKLQDFGYVIRYSRTLKKELLYVSKKFTLKQEDYYIRMARDIELINQQFLYLFFNIGLLFLLFMIISFLLLLNISNNIQSETKAILDFVRNLTKQTKSIKIKSTYSIEFHKIIKLLTSVSHNLAKKNKQKSKYTAKLKLSNRQKDDIISAISHEFKNPIAIINGYTQTLIEDTNILPNIREKFLTKIASNADKLTNMIDRLRLSIKLEQGKQIYSFINSDLNNIIHSCVDDLKYSYPHRNIIIKSEKVEKKIEETIFGLAITNIIENALKYSQDDIMVILTESSLSIIDNGIGIKQGDIAKVTNKFYRVSSNSWNNSLGVGLSLVKNIIELHKFKLEIHSIYNNGSTFKIIFNKN